ncbi:uncharacterized protein VTP21DRAFT_6423 [Calcarisporiella thermophila]|uniref:uncharacterized protein n=1 Tax=Calcarisporiella thermophila TaxID=911321 RepID=UPI0037440711
MSLPTFFGCLLTAYGPSLVLFFAYLARNAQLVLLVVSSAFFWLISILLSSVLWFAIVPARQLHPLTIAYSVLLQELFRWLLFVLINRAEAWLNLVAKNPKSLYNRAEFSFACGYGFGLMNALVNYSSLLAVSIGPGTVMCRSCSFASLFIISAINVSFFVLLHIVWMMLAFEGFSGPRRSYVRIGWVILSHFVASYVTLLNSSEVNLGCIYVILVHVVLFAVSCGMVGRSLNLLHKKTLAVGS